MDESEWLAQQSFTSWQSATESHDQEQIWQAKRSAKDILAGDQPKVLNSSVESKDIHLRQSSETFLLREIVRQSTPVPITVYTNT